MRPDSGLVSPPREKSNEVLADNGYSRVRMISPMDVVLHVTSASGRQVGAVGIPIWLGTVTVRVSLKNRGRSCVTEKEYVTLTSETLSDETPVIRA